MDKKLFVQAIVKFLSGMLMFALLLFIPAGTLNNLNNFVQPKVEKISTVR